MGAAERREPLEGTEVRQGSSYSTACFQLSSVTTRTSRTKPVPYGAIIQLDCLDLDGTVNTMQEKPRAQNISSIA